MDAKASHSGGATTSVMVLMVTLIATYLNSDLIRLLASMGEGVFRRFAGGGNDRLFVAPARHLTDRIVTLIDGRH